MATVHTSLLQQIQRYIEEYVSYLGSTTSIATPQVNDDLRRIIDELEQLQAHPQQTEETQRLAARIGDQIEHLRHSSESPRRAVVRHPQQTLAQALHRYIDQEMIYLAKVGGSARRDQINLLLSDIIADLKALALDPTDEQAEQLAADIDAKRQQASNLQRPWQQMHGWNDTP